MSPVKPGMTRRQVKRLLGRPTDSLSMRQFLGSYSNVSTFSPFTRFARSGAWMYVDSPSKRKCTMLMFARGRVVEVQVSDTPR